MLGGIIIHLPFFCWKFLLCKLYTSAQSMKCGCHLPVHGYGTNELMSHLKGSSGLHVCNQSIQNCYTTVPCSSTQICPFTALSILMGSVYRARCSSSLHIHAHMKVSGVPERIIYCTNTDAGHTQC